MLINPLQINSSENFQQFSAKIIYLPLLIVKGVIFIIMPKIHIDSYKTSSVQGLFGFIAPKCFLICYLLFRFLSEM